ncbi:MAG: hypothetical protein DI598_03110 [Pseudopedobacter saltans]|uniref:Thioredoxin domain-containing protein n=1 Tax=Pseudopedobacter saltans TaxID=151895 RepID=A0A2W5F642_9SPHI|nr:MAG: hypothetical protein DI598_03110 [Pseudopedobacter saltans]
MKIKTIIIVMGMLLPVLSIRAQDMRPLSIGDTVPDLVLHNVINYKDSVIRLSDFKDKLVILDFWATWCGNCVAAFPKMEDLQRQFGDSIQIIAVGYEPRKKIADFLQKRKHSAYAHLPFVTLDTTLIKLFPHRLLPHEIWIDCRRRFLLPSDDYAVTSTNIKRALCGQKPIAKPKIDILRYDKSVSFFDATAGQKAIPVMYRSLISHSIDGLSSKSGFHTDTAAHTKRLFFLNYPIMEMLKAACGVPFDNRVVNRMKENTLSEASISQTMPTDTYCYELTLGDSVETPAFYNYVRTDLGRLFNINIAVDSVVSKAYILTTNSRYKAHSICDTPKAELLESPEEGKVYRYTNYPLSDISDWINSRMPIPLINKIPRNRRITMKLHNDNIGNLTLLRNELSTQGLDLTPAKTKIRVLVVSAIHP